MAHDLVTELLQYSSLACFIPIWQLCANLLIPNCLRSTLSYSPLAALEFYVKEKDIRNLRINVNPTNLVAIELARKFWKTEDGKSNLKAWDLISPSRASSNIGEFAILLPGEEQIVLTKEVFVIRVNKNDYGYTPFYLLWALSLVETRKQWARVTLMQTNREDVGQRYKEIIIPKPVGKEWAEKVSRPFAKYFKQLADAKQQFAKDTSSDNFDYIASVSAFD